MDNKHYYIISGKKNGKRLDSRILEEKIQYAASKGYKDIKIRAYGQHGIGGRLWKAGKGSLYIKIEGQAGQRVGSMGFSNTFIDVMGSASDDVGWLNAGAQIVVHGNAANGTANGMAQGKVYIGGNIGARGMTMTKHNPRFDPPELWVLGSAGDYFGEFMAGGIAVICGFDAQNRKNILGYRPFVGMVGGKTFFRGPHSGFSTADAKLAPINEDDWNWLIVNLEKFLEKIGRSELFTELSERNQWQLLVALTPKEKSGRKMRSMKSFKENVWDKELGQGGLIGDLTAIDRSPIPVITTGNLRRFVPVWENLQYIAPCEASCPTGMPVHERWRLIRDGRIDEAVDMALAYTPFPATVCGYLCPNLCMRACTRQSASMIAVDVAQLGKASIKANLPKLPPLSGKRIAVIGGGPSGISVSWQLRRHGHEAIIYDMSEKLGGRLLSVIPDSRIPEKIVAAELERIKSVISHVHLRQRINREDFKRLRKDFEFLVIAAGAQKPKTLPVPGNERMIAAIDFLAMAKSGKAKAGKRVVIIGAGNVGCDAATEAHRLGAEDITLIDVQDPSSFGKERKAAESAGAKFRRPCYTKEITKKGVLLTTGELLPADMVIISIGDAPDTEFLPEDIETDHGFIVVNEQYRTSDPKIFAIGDVVKPGLLTDAIGAGQKAAKTISDILNGKSPAAEDRPVIAQERIILEYFDPRISRFEDIEQCGSQCASCGTCRDCGICVEICPQGAISRKELENDDYKINYEYVVDEELCIGCGFCAAACPCGIWNLVANEPIA